jgi:hypothetical protein
MAAQVMEPGVDEPHPVDPGEFHPISVVLAQDFTDVTCAVCGPLEHTGSGEWHAVAHGSDHAIETGHTVLERHVRLIVISERS